MTRKSKIITISVSLIALTIITMGLFKILKSKSSDSKFVSESSFNKNLKSQMDMKPQTLEQLRKINVSADKELKLEFFFYTNSLDKASQLSAELKKLNYASDHGFAAGSKTEYLVNGWTNKIKMSDEVVKDWTKQMCEIGYKYDCEFDGWGTDPGQDVN